MLLVPHFAPRSSGLCRWVSPSANATLRVHVLTNCLFQYLLSRVKTTTALTTLSIIVRASQAHPESRRGADVLLIAVHLLRILSNDTASRTMNVSGFPSTWNLEASYHHVSMGFQEVAADVNVTAVAISKRGLLDAPSFTLRTGFNCRQLTANFLLNLSLTFPITRRLRYRQRVRGAQHLRHQGRERTCFVRDRLGLCEL